VGSDLLASAMCMDKRMTNTMMDVNGIAQAKWRGFTRQGYAENGAALLREAAQALGFPIFVKPANAGSSVGITKVKQAEDLPAAVESAFLHDGKALLEEGIDGMEVECAVWGNACPVASTVGEVVPCNEFYDYAAKYIDNGSVLHIPARLAEDVRLRIRETACAAYRAMGCAGLARVDFFVRRDTNEVLINEINTVPGFTAISMYAKLFEASGVPLSALVSRLLELADERRQES